MQHERNKLYTYGPETFFVDSDENVWTINRMTDLNNSGPFLPPELKASENNRYENKRVQIERVRLEDNLQKSKLRPILMRMQGNRCFVCRIDKNTYGHNFDTHRIVPGKCKGKYILGNAILVCRSCHNQVEGLTNIELYLQVTAI